MKLFARLSPRYAPAILAILVPAVLVYSSVRTFRELDQMKSVFLRNRSAAIAAQLETLDTPDSQAIEALVDSEPGVLAIRVVSSPGDPSLADLWRGRELFRTEMVRENGLQVFRALVPFHAGGQLRIAAIDIDASSADFLLVHARHNVITSTVSGIVVVLLCGYALWSMRRAAQQEKTRLELAHLAHLGKMSAVLAHEIRTPLGTIKGFTQLALEKADRGIQAMLEPVLTETERLERLVGDLLLYGRPPKPAPAECSWEAIIPVLGQFGPHVTIDRSPVALRTDARMLGQVVSNMIRNASDAVSATPGGRVDVLIREDGSDVVITVEDNGPGIPQEQLGKVFEAFYTTKSFGTGLGLPISRSLIAALGGSLSLAPRPGGGLRVEIRLPAAGTQHTAEVKI
jgi:signal transduction histidine kinase